MKKVTPKVTPTKAPKQTRKSPDKALIDDMPVKEAVVVEEPVVSEPMVKQLCWWTRPNEEPWLGHIESLDPLVVIRHTRRGNVHATDEVSVNIADYTLTPATTADEYEYLH